MNKKKDKKNVTVNFENPEARMKLKVRGVDNAIKIMMAFDKACKEIRMETKKEQ